MAAAVGIGRFIYTPILPFMAADLKLTTGAAGIIASANFLGYLIGAVAAGLIGIRQRQRDALLIALAVSAATTGLMAAASSMGAFLALRLAGGAASAVVLVLGSSLVLERLARADRGRLSAVHFSGVGAGIAASAVVTWASVRLGGDWRAIWLGGSALAGLALILVAVLLPGEQARAVMPDAPRPDGARRLWRLVAAYGLFGFGYVITATFIVAVVRGAGMSRDLEVAIWLAVGLAAVVSVPGWTAVGRRVGILPAFAIACLVEAAGVASSVVFTSPAGLIAAGILLGGTFMGITALGLMAGRVLTAGDPRRSLAALTAAFGLGQMIGPPVAGYGHDLTGDFVFASMLAAAALVLAAGLAVSIDRAVTR